MTHRTVYVTKTNNLELVFHKNNYFVDFIRRNIYRPTEADTTNSFPTPVTTVTTPYIKGTSETISRILQPYNIRVAHKHTTTLRHLLTKNRDEPNNRQGAVYKIKCSDCQASNTVETGRNLNTRMIEHKRATRNADDVNNHDKLYTSLSANTIMAKVTNHFQRTKLITSSTDKHYSLDSEDDFRSGCRNVSHQQQFFSELPSPGRYHTKRITDTPGFKPFTMLGNLALLRRRMFPSLDARETYVADTIFARNVFVSSKNIFASRTPILLLKHVSQYHENNVD